MTTRCVAMSTGFIRTRTGAPHLRRQSRCRLGSHENVISHLFYHTISATREIHNTTMAAVNRWRCTSCPGVGKNKMEAQSGRNYQLFSSSFYLHGWLMLDLHNDHLRRDVAVTTQPLNLREILFAVPSGEHIQRVIPRQKNYFFAGVKSRISFKFFLKNSSLFIRFSGQRKIFSDN